MKDIPDYTPKSLLSRRAYLLGTVGVAATSLSSSLTHPVSARTLDVTDGDDITPQLEQISDGETVTVPSGTYKLSSTSISANNFTLDGQGCTFVPQSQATTLHISGDNWQFGHIRFDTSGPNNITVLPSGGDWKFHNCAWDGPNTGGESVDFLFAPAVADGTKGVAESIWWGSGFGPDTTESAVKHLGDISGEMHYKRCYWWQNGTYATETAASNRSSGTVHFHDCYLEDCWHAGIRLGSDYGTCTVNNCTLVWNDVDVTLHEATRALWSFWGPVEVRNTDILANHGMAISTSSRTEPPAHESGPVDVYGGNVVGTVDDDHITLHNVGSNPSKTPPKGCPTSVQEAVGGTTTQGTGTTNPPTRVLKLVSGEDTSTISYEFTVDGTIEKRTSAGDVSAENNDSITTNTTGTMTATGLSGNGFGDSYTITGPITDIQLDESKWTLYLDGTKVTVDELLSGSGTGTESLSNTLVIDGTNTSQDTTYTVSVTGTIKADSSSGLDSEDTINDDTVSGAVNGGKDTYLFSGEITDVQLDGPATVQVDESNT